MFYDKFLKLCNQVGKKPKDVAKELGVKTSTLSMWKTKGVTPNAVTLTKLADYFGVLVVDLLDDNTSKIYKAGFIDGAVAESMQNQEATRNTQKDESPDMAGKTVTFQPFVETDIPLITPEDYRKIAKVDGLPQELADDPAFMERVNLIGKQILSLTASDLDALTKYVEFLCKGNK